MSYTVCSSEKLRKSGADAETKAMLYLMNFREDSSEMNYFVVDFFNDVTGMDRMGRKLWDVQSKASKTASAKGIGQADMEIIRRAHYMEKQRIMFLQVFI